MTLLNTLSSLLVFVSLAVLMVPVQNHLLEKQAQKVRVRSDENERER